MEQSKSSFLLDWMSDEEFRLSQLLAKASLVVEANLSEDEVRRAQEFYGRRAKELLRVASPPEQIIKRYPALTLSILVGHAGLAYEQGRYWDEFWDELALPRELAFENALRAQLVPLLRRFKLAEFDDLHGDYIRLMAMHAGIPVHCLGDLAALIERHQIAGRESSGAALVEWLTAPHKQYRMNNLDVPVRNFLVHGGEFAVDILDRIIEFVDYTTQNEDWDELTLETSTTGLPSMLLGALIEHVRDGGEAAPRLRTRRSTRPDISFSFRDEQVLVSIPYPSSSPEVPWRLSLDGDTSMILAERGWGVAEQDHPPTPVALARPVREVILQHVPSGASHRLPVVDKDDPILLFTPDGKALKRRSALPNGPVFALYPSDASLFDPQTKRRIEPATESVTPAGWSGWLAVQIDLTGHHAIQLERKGTDTTAQVLGVERRVRTTAVPSYDLPDPIVGLKTVSGLSVYADRPSVTLPQHSGNEPVDWRIRTRRVGDSGWLVDDVWVSDAFEDTAVDPFDGCPEGLAGLYEIVVSGPLGSDLRQNLFLAEGVSVVHSSDFRTPTPGGLSPISTVVMSAASLDVDRRCVEFATDQRERPIEISDDTRSFRLILRPPYIEMRLDEIGKPARWRTSVPIVTPDELGANAVVAVRIPGEVSVSLALEDRYHEVVQDETPDVCADGAFQLSSRKFVDSVRATGDCRIVALVEDSDRRTARVTIAQIRTARLCTEMSLIGDELFFADLKEQADLAVYLWAACAPWKPAHAIPVSGPSLQLPSDLVEVGSLVGELFIDDPWINIVPPRWPGESSHRIAQAGYVRDVDSTLEELSGFLAGVGTLPARCAATSEVWSALEMLALDPGPDAERQRVALSRTLLRDPRVALNALGNSTIPVENVPSLLIRTGLVRSAFHAADTLNELHTNPWIGCMVEIADLRSLFERRAIVADERAETIAYLADRGGALLIETLRVGKALDLNYGLFDAGVSRLDDMSEEQVEEIIEHSQLVPGAYLDLDMRVAGNIEAFRHRSEWVYDGWSPGFGAATASLLKAIGRKSQLIYDVISARSEALAGLDTPQRPWLLLSLQSLTLAFAARLHAHRMLDRSPSESAVDEAWIRMAELCPGMVMADLLIAEALVTFVQHGDLIGVGE